MIAHSLFACGLLCLLCCKRGFQVRTMLQRCLIPIRKGFHFQLCLQLAEVKGWMIGIATALLVLFCILIATTFPFFGSPQSLLITQPAFNGIIRGALTARSKKRHRTCQVERKTMKRWEPREFESCVGAFMALFGAIIGVPFAYIVSVLFWQLASID